MENLLLDKSGGVVKAYNNILINNQLNLTDGYLELLGDQLSIATGGQVLNGGVHSFIITTAGCLQFEALDSAIPKTFPIGVDSTSFAPASLGNSGTSDDFCIRVANKVHADGSESGSRLEHVVEKTWYIDEAQDGGSNVDLRLYWDADYESASFNRDNGAIIHYNDNSVCGKP